MDNGGVLFMEWKVKQSPDFFIVAYVASHPEACYVLVLVYILKSKNTHVCPLIHKLTHKINGLHGFAKLDINVSFEDP